MKVKVRIIATGLYSFDTEDYVDAWQELCEEDGHEEGDDYPSVPKDFALEKLQQDLEDGTIELGDALENADLDVKEANT